jgi:hypothetical protein
LWASIACHELVPGFGPPTILKTVALLRYRAIDLQKVADTIEEGGHLYLAVPNIQKYTDTTLDLAWIRTQNNG